MASCDYDLIIIGGGVGGSALAAGMAAAGARTLVLEAETSFRDRVREVLARSFAGTTEDACIERFLECFDPGRVRILRPEKARTTAYLATTRNPHVSVGVAAKQGVWEFDHDAFRTIREFLSGLGGP